MIKLWFRPMFQLDSQQTGSHFLEQNLNNILDSDQAHLGEGHLVVGRLDQLADLDLHPHLVLDLDLQADLVLWLKVLKQITVFPLLLMQYHQQLRETPPIVKILKTAILR